MYIVSIYFISLFIYIYFLVYWRVWKHFVLKMSFWHLHGSAVLCRTKFYVISLILHNRLQAHFSIPPLVNQVPSRKGCALPYQIIKTHRNFIRLRQTWWLTCTYFFSLWCSNINHRCWKRITPNDLNINPYQQICWMKKGNLVKLLSKLFLCMLQHSFAWCITPTL